MGNTITEEPQVYCSCKDEYHYHNLECYESPYDECDEHCEYPCDCECICGGQECES